MNELISYVDTRAAEVATDAIASDVAQVHQDMLDADADAQAAAASAAAAAGTLANAVKKTGEASQSIAGNIAISGDLTVGGTAGFTGAVTVPAPANNTDAATKKYVDDADALKLNITDVNSYAVGLTGNQGPIAGVKSFANGISAYQNDWHNTYITSSTIGDIQLFAKLKNPGAGKFIEMEFIQSSNTAVCYGIMLIKNATTPVFGWALQKGFGSNNPMTSDCMVIATDGVDIYLGSRKKTTYGNLNCRVMQAHDYGVIGTNPTNQIEWLDSPINIGTGTGYTLTEATP